MNTQVTQVQTQMTQMFGEGYGERTQTLENTQFTKSQLGFTQRMLNTNFGRTSPSLVGFSLKHLSPNQAMLLDQNSQQRKANGTPMMNSPIQTPCAFNSGPTVETQVT